jgi:hypothetical protein
MLTQDWEAVFDSFKFEVDRSRDDTRETMESKLHSIINFLGSRIDGHHDTALLKRIDTLIDHTHTTEESFTKHLESCKYSDTMIQKSWTS